MKSKILSQGAEAKISREGNSVIKERIAKGYRHKELDNKIRSKRTEREIKILERAISANINVPGLISKQSRENIFLFKIEYLEGDKLSEKLNSYTKEKRNKIMHDLGIEVGKLHEIDIIHGDLTTSNTILAKDKVFIIDFGLGFISQRTEDRAVDLHLIKQALQAKHFENSEESFVNFIKGYSKNYKEAKSVLDRLKKVESRGRYKSNY